jgi:glycosyltransferase involved in cell wall biosynthesis
MTLRTQPAKKYDHIPVLSMSGSSRERKSRVWQVRSLPGRRLHLSKNVIVMDADLSHSPEQIPQLLQPLISGDADMVIGSRYIEKAAISSWPISRKIASWGASFPAQLLTGLSDPLSGFFAIRKQWFDNYSNRLPGFKIGLELLANNNPDFRAVEVPITFVNRRKGSSKMNPAVISSYVSQLARISKLSTPGISLIAIIACGFVAAAVDSGLTILFSTVGEVPATAHVVSYLLALNIAYVALYLFNKIVGGTGSVRYQKNGYGRFLFFITAMLFIRGGFLAVLTNDLSIVTLRLSLIQSGTTFNFWILSIPVFLKSFVFRQKTIRMETYHCPAGSLQCLPASSLHGICRTHSRRGILLELCAAF